MSVTLEKPLPLAARCGSRKSPPFPLGVSSATPRLLAWSTHDSSGYLNRNGGEGEWRSKQIRGRDTITGLETSFSPLDTPMKYDHGNRHSRGGAGDAGYECTRYTRGRSARIMSHKIRRGLFFGEQGRITDGGNSLSITPARTERKIPLGERSSPWACMRGESASRDRYRCASITM